MFRQIDPRSSIPLYVQIADRIRIAVATGEMPSGGALPSVRNLASQLRVNPATVVQAYRELEEVGVVESRQGAGTFVRELAEPKRDAERQRLARRLVRQLLQEAAALGVMREDLEQALRVEMKVKLA
ncbi:MAG TPA: GntR family transcriptional regulator [Candidatus Methylomirabilis sp.]|nr:GntR family transcriptional regulator [Candidatus Methylomirabilis sp.]